MDDTLRGKRLLVLGGNPWADIIKKIVDAYGIVMIAAGNDPGTKLFQYADETYVADSTDASSMKKLIVEKKIDGVYMGGSEPVISAACDYISSLGLPCYCTRARWEMLQDKKKFKRLCIEHGLPVVPQMTVDENDMESFPPENFPVITKPSDGSGSRGFSVCRNMEELKEGYRFAKESSFSGSVIVEKFVNNRSVIVLYTVCAGKILYSGLSDKYPVKFEKEGSYVGGLYVFESSAAGEFREKYEAALQAMITELGIRSGTFWIEAFHDSGDFCFNEAGFRYGGIATMYPAAYVSGINQVEADIYYALTGRCKTEGWIPVFEETQTSKTHYAIYPVYVSSGVISEVVMAPEYENEVVRIERSGIGDTVKANGSFGQAFALIHMAFDSCRELVNTIAEIQRTVHVYDENGKDMVLNMFALSRIPPFHAFSDDKEERRTECSAACRMHGSGHFSAVYVKEKGHFPA